MLNGQKVASLRKEHKTIKAFEKYINDEIKAFAKTYKTIALIKVEDGKVEVALVVSQTMRLPGKGSLILK